MDQLRRMSWVATAQNSEFSIHNLPFGIFSLPGRRKRAGVAIGNDVVDLQGAHELGVLQSDFDPSVLAEPFLNSFIGLGKSRTSRVRTDLQSSLCDPDSPLRDSSALMPREGVTMHLPVQVGDYTDFYSSLEHATNVGSMFRDPDNPLLPNWRHMPIAYHGRSSSIVVSGASIYRPYGQIKLGDEPPYFGPTKRLDFELEMAFVVGKSTKQGEIVSTSQAEEHIFGLLLFNDWSARDVQRWEYVPLGPFLGKNFGSSVSPWIVTLEALAPFRTSGPVQEPPVLPYLQFDGGRNFDIALTVDLQPNEQEASTICQSNFKYMYWNMCQQLAHHTSNGCTINVGDLMASGTISGPQPGSFGSMLELSRGGRNPITLVGGVQRRFLEDGDRVTMRGYCSKDDIHVGFGEVTTKILPAFM